MAIILQILAIVFLLVGIGSTIIILIDMFQDAIWKGLVGLLCGLYLLYYAFFDFEHDNKWLIIACAIGGSAISTGLMGVAATMR